MTLSLSKREEKVSIESREVKRWFFRRGDMS